jgi:hypothetical protein
MAAMTKSDHFLPLPAWEARRSSDAGRPATERSIRVASDPPVVVCRDHGAPCARYLPHPRRSHRQASTTGSKKANLQLRATPVASYVPAIVHLTATLGNVDEVEEWYCPEVEWNWDSGSLETENKSFVESNCPPFAPDAKVQRTFAADHLYSEPGQYQIKLTLKHAGKTLATAVARVSTVRKGWAGSTDKEPGH